MEDIYYFENMEQIRTLGEPSRFQMLNLLVTRPMTGSQLARELGLPRPLAHYHLKILEKMGLVAFQESKLLGGVVEKYFRAVAAQYRTDHLVDSYRAEAGARDPATLQTGEVLRELMKAIIELARSDLARPDSISQLARMGFNQQEDVYLTREQVNELIRTLRNLGDQYVQLSRQNQSQAEADATPELIHLRYTWLLTPPAEFNQDSGPSGRKRKKTASPTWPEGTSIAPDEEEVAPPAG